MPRRRGHRWRQLRAYILATRPPVCFCGNPIDLTLPMGHDLAPVVDHITPLAQGGQEFDPANCRPAHNKCNRDRATTPEPAKASRTW